MWYSSVLINTVETLRDNKLFCLIFSSCPIKKAELMSGWVAIWQLSKVNHHSCQSFDLSAARADNFPFLQPIGVMIINIFPWVGHGIKGGLHVLFYSRFLTVIAFYYLKYIQIIQAKLRSVLILPVNKWFILTIKYKSWKLFLHYDSSDATCTHLAVKKMKKLAKSSKLPIRLSRENFLLE